MTHSLQGFYRSRVLLFGAATAVILTVSACGGGGGGGGGEIGFNTSLPVPPPPPSTVPPPPDTTIYPPVENTSAPLVPGVLSPSPAPIEATSTADNFSSITGRTTYRCCRRSACPPVLPAIRTPLLREGRLPPPAPATIRSRSMRPCPGIHTRWRRRRRWTQIGENLDYTRFGDWLYYYPTEGPTIQAGSRRRLRHSGGRGPDVWDGHLYRQDRRPLRRKPPLRMPGMGNPELPGQHGPDCRLQRADHQRELYRSQVDGRFCSERNWLGASIDLERRQLYRSHRSYAQLVHRTDWSDQPPNRGSSL